MPLKRAVLVPCDIPGLMSSCGASLVFTAP